MINWLIIPEVDYMDENNLGSGWKANVLYQGFALLNCLLSSRSRLSRFTVGLSVSFCDSVCMDLNKSHHANV